MPPGTFSAAARINTHMGDHRLKPVLDVAAVACPRCNALSLFHRDGALIDACGFESYRFACDGCGAELAGIIDPADDTFLLSELAA
jgi:hypothetical protein